jgi:DNA repair exonuclease SbcCD ATPase subunit
MAGSRPQDMLDSQCKRLEIELKGVIEVLLDELKNLDTDRMSLEDAVELSAYGRMVEAEFITLGVGAPEWLPIRLKELRREIRTRRQDLLDKRLREAKNRLQALKPTEERRAETQAAIDRMEAEAAQLATQ